LVEAPFPEVAGHKTETPTSCKVLTVKPVRPHIDDALLSCLDGLVRVNDLDVAIRIRGDEVKVALATVDEEGATLGLNAFKARGLMLRNDVAGTH
jgi:hypothetical protein